DVVDRLPFVAPHEEHTDLDAVALRRLGGPAHLLGRDPPLHGVEDALAAALRTDPDAVAAHLRQRGEHLLAHHAVGARNGFERQPQAAPLQLAGVVEEPAVVDGEDVVGVPDLVRPVAVADVLDLVGHVEPAPPPVAEAEDGVRAPAALVGTAAGGDQVDAAHAVMPAPDLDVALLIDRLAIGPGERVEVGDLRPLAVV